MKMRSIGGLQVSLAGLGCASFGWWVDEPQTQAVVHAALDAGVNLFDCADEYGEGRCEEYLGRALGSRRNDVNILTKFAGGTPGDGTRPGSAAWIRHSCEKSLARLNTDRIDLYLIHHPDPLTPIAETLEALRDLQQEGKVREIGCSNMMPEELQEAASAAAQLGMTGFATVETSYSLLDRTAETSMVPACERLDVPILPYFPLASGMLTGKYRRGEVEKQDGRLNKDLLGLKVKDYFPALFTDQCFNLVESLERYARDHGHSLSQLALAWVASRPWVGSVIAGATSSHQVTQNAAAVLDWELTPAQQAEIAVLTTADYAYTWIHGMPAYTQPPPGTVTDVVPRVDPVSPGIDAALSGH